MEQEKISIIVPVYNIEADLSRCLDSLLGQTHGNLEIIAVDDGSPDNCGAILDSYAAKDGRVIVIHQKNGGVTRARVTGIRAATGDWVGFVDGDDYVEPDMFARLLDNARKYGADISHCGYQMVFPNRVDYYHNTGKILEQDGQSGLRELLDGSQVEPGLWNKLYRRNLMEGLLNSGVDALGIRINEDLLMNYYLFRDARKAVYEDFCPYHYIVRGNSAANTRNRECHVTDPIRVTEILSRENRETPKLYALSQRRYARALISGALQKHFPALAAEAKRKLRELEYDVLPRKERYMAMTVAYARPLYRAVRWVYEKITRVNHKYDLE